MPSTQSTKDPGSGTAPGAAARRQRGRAGTFGKAGRKAGKPEEIKTRSAACFACQGLCFLRRHSVCRLLHHRTAAILSVDGLFVLLPGLCGILYGPQIHCGQAAKKGARKINFKPLEAVFSVLCGWDGIRQISVRWPVPALHAQPRKAA